MANKNKFIFYQTIEKEIYIKLREKEEGLQNCFLSKIDKSQSRINKLNQLVKILQNNGWKINKNDFL